MATYLHRNGGNFILNVEGTKFTLVKAGPELWRDQTDGDLVVHKINDALLFNSGGSRLFAMPTNVDTWILAGSDVEIPDPDPDPGGGGDFSWPYALDYVTSEYGPRSGRFHEGIDFSGGPALYGDPIPSIADGVVYASFYGSGFGNHIAIYHGEIDNYDRYSTYSHMVNLSSLSVGASVSKGDTLGLVNNTGSSQGSHLHMEIHKVAPGGSMISDYLNPSYSSNRTAVNPRTFFSNYGDGNAIYN